MGVLDVTAVAADRLTSCVANIWVVALLPSEEWSTVMFKSAAVKQCNSVLDGDAVKGACARQ